MKIKSGELTVGEKILIFVGYCLPNRQAGLSHLRRKFSYHELKQTLDDFGSSCELSTLRKEFSHLKAAGLITFKKRYRKPTPCLSVEGKLKIATALAFKKFGAWDNRWRLVIADIPESERKARLVFQGKLEELGYRRVAKGVYITPHPLLSAASRFATTLGIRQYCLMVEADKIDRENATIQKIWALDEINDAYYEFLRTAKKTRRLCRKISWPFRAKALEHQFSRLYSRDPHLPKELMPHRWHGEVAYKAYKEISNSY